MFTVLASALALHGASAITATEAEMHRANPVRRVVTMLQDMEKKVKAEGERDEDPAWGNVLRQGDPFLWRIRADLSCSAQVCAALRNAAQIRENLR